MNDIFDSLALSSVLAMNDVPDFLTSTARFLRKEPQSA